MAIYKELKIFSVFLSVLTTISTSDGTTDLTCDFQSSFCGMSQDIKDDFDWIRKTGKTASVYTGPKMDHTLQTDKGYYIYIETSKPRKNGDIARLTGPYMRCHESTITFWYHMYGRDINKLLLYAVGDDGQKKAIWSKHGEKGDYWQKGTMQVTSSVIWRIVIEGYRGSNYRGDIALDDLSIVCENPVYPYLDTTSIKDQVSTETSPRTQPDTTTNDQSTEGTSFHSSPVSLYKTSVATEEDSSTMFTDVFKRLSSDGTTELTAVKTSLALFVKTPTTEVSTFFENITTSQTTVIRKCKCPCKQIGDSSVVNMTLQHLALIMEETKKELIVNKSQLSSFIRKKISVKDYRPTSNVIGAVGVVVFVVIGMLLLGIDMLRLCGKVSKS